MTPLQGWRESSKTTQPIHYDEKGFLAFQHLLTIIFKGAFDSMGAWNKILNRFRIECATQPTKYEADSDILREM